MTEVFPQKTHAETLIKVTEEYTLRPKSGDRAQLMYAEEHQDADVQYLTLTDEEYDAMFPVEDEE